MSGPAPEITTSAAPRDRVIDALMALAAERPFEDISISDIARRADVSLSQFRDCFPSKGAVLAGFSRRIDTIVLDGSTDDLVGEPAKERLFDVLMRRLDAMRPYKAGLESVLAWARREPVEAAALNRVAINSMRFMLEAASVDSNGALGAVKLQGLVLAFARVVETWLRDEDQGLAATMAALDRELTRGGQIVARLDDFHRLASPFRALVRAALDAPRAFGDRRRGRREPASDEEAGAA